MEENNFDWVIDIPVTTKVTLGNVCIGLWVKLSQQSEFYYQAPNVFGKITDLRIGDHWVVVKWENGNINYYRVGPDVFDLVTII